MKTFFLEGPIVPKARARTTANGTYHPHRYKSWKENAVFDLESQYTGAPLSGVSVSVEFHGKHRRNSDLDNMLGAILDALVQAGVLKDDSLMHVVAVAGELAYSKESPETLIFIR